MTHRVTLSRVRGWRMPEGARVVTRSTVFGNPWACGTDQAFWWPHDPRGPRWVSTHRVPRLRLTAHEAVGLYTGWLRLAWVPRGALPVGLTEHGITACRDALDARRLTILGALPALRGRPLACWCPPDSPCHADVLLELANG